MSKEPAKPHITKDLCQWVSTFALDQCPDDVQLRAKHIILDGIGCGLIGAHLPWSETAVKALFAVESPGNSTIIGWDRKLSPLAAALLNSSFIQGFELDDWHSEAPLHSNSLILPTLLALAQHLKASEGRTITGKELLAAVIVGFEVGPRVGNALWGTHILTTGWHSGAVFGPAAVAAAASHLWKLSAEQLEDAFGTACTQACGLMSAQFGSDTKRMQHGFAARNGLLATILARQGYTGIKDVFELSYGGFLKQFSAGNGKTPGYLPEELTKGLGSQWQINNICLKPYASMAATHGVVDCIRILQNSTSCPTGQEAVNAISKIRIIQGEAAFSHGGFEISRPLEMTGAQMSASFVAATQFIHGSVLPAQFRREMLEDNDTWAIANKTSCHLAEKSTSFGATSVEVTTTDGRVFDSSVDNALGVDPALSNDQLVTKFDSLMEEVIEKDRGDKIKALVLKLEECQDVEELLEFLSKETKNPIE